MINEGNSLAELQARVLRASPHAKKSEILWRELLDPSPQWSKHLLQLLTKSDHNRQYLGDWYLPVPKQTWQKLSVPKANPRAISVVGSQLAGRRAEIVILDDVV